MRKMNVQVHKMGDTITHVCSVFHIRLKLVRIYICGDEGVKTDNEWV